MATDTQAGARQCLSGS